MNTSGQVSNRQPQVMTAINSLEKSVQELEAILTDLLERLQPIIAEGRTEQVLKEPPDAIVCPLAHMIRDKVKSLDACIDTIKYIVNSVEL